MTDEVSSSAMVLTDGGVLVAIHRSKDGSVKISLTLTRSNLDLFDPELGFMVRVDERKPHVFRRVPDSLLRIGIAQTLYWRPTYVSAPAWSGKESDGRSRLIHELMSGSRFQLRYFSSTGGAKDSSALLSGAGPAIAAALGISVEESEASRNNRAMWDRYTEQSDSCGPTSSAGFDDCRKKARDCKKASSSLPEMDRCFGWAGR